MTALYCKILILCWKCLILRWRNIIITLLELVIPILIFIIQSYVFHLVSEEVNSKDQKITKMLMKSSRKNEIPESMSSIFFYNFLGDFDIVYTPPHNVTDAIMQRVIRKLHRINPDSKITNQSKESADDLNAWLKERSVSLDLENDEFSQNPDMGVIFHDVFFDPNKSHEYEYTLRTTLTSMITNEDKREEVTLVEYLKSMFLGMEMDINTVILRREGYAARIPWMFGDFPTRHSQVIVATLLLYIFLIFAFLFLVVSAIKDVLVEKECGIKELMKVMGVNSWMIWFHWFIYILIVQILVIIGATIIFTLWKPVVISAGFMIVFILLLLFIINFTVMLFVVTCLFYKTTTALAACLIVWFVFNIAIYVKIVVQPENVSPFVEWLSTLYPLCNLCWALSSLWSFHAYHIKWKWSMLFKKGYSKFRTTVGVSILSFILSTILHALLLLYLDALFPGPYGVPQPWYFPYQWVVQFFKTDQPIEETEVVHDAPDFFEPTSKSSKVGISLRGLNKKYGFIKKKTAVECVDLDIYRGEIMALLGHNGAGKTTTMSMITGMTVPSDGMIIFEGEDITVNKKKFRESLGLCPQHNLYFPKLTVLEHLMFFGMFKGMSYKESKKNGKNLLYSLNMLEKASVVGSKLSGGMQRRLCLAVALTGEPKVLVLDEPTSGLDPETRRLLWDIILKMRGDRTVLISTHFMEEADVLGDRIAIMDHGKVVCCGTSIFLKKIFGAGYQIHVLKSPNASVDAITNVVKQNIQQYQVNVVSKVQVDYIVKEEFIESFPSLFSSLEGRKENLNITGITVTCASMEDVFLKVANLPVGDAGQLDKEPQSLSEALNINEFERVTGMALIFQQMRTLFERRIIYRRRHIISLIIKTLFLILAMILLTLQSKITRIRYVEQMPFELNFNAYPESTALVSSETGNTTITDYCEKVATMMSGKVKVFENATVLDEYLQKESEDNLNYVKDILFSVQFYDDVFSLRYHGHRNPHAPAIAINFLSNVLLLNQTNGTGSIKITNHPYVNTDSLGVCNKEKTRALALEIVIIYCYLLFFSVIFIVVLSDMLWLIIEERVSGFKHQQFLAGAPPPIYWLVNLIFDFCIYFITVLILLFIFAILGPHIVFLRFIWLGLFILVLFLLGLAGISVTYMFSLLIDNPGTSLAVYNVLMICLGVFPALVISTGVMAYIPFINYTLFMIISHLLCLNPISAAILCLRYIIKGIIFEEVCRVCMEQRCYKDSEMVRVPTEDDYSGMLSFLYVLIYTAILYPLIVLLLDCGLVRRILLLIFSKEPDFEPLPDADEDVKTEMERVEAYKYEDQETPLRVESLEKKYMFGPKAVNKVSFIIMEGECFGLLGVNGAGKSTVFKILTAEVKPNKGDAFVYAYSLKSDTNAFISSIGYCPQTDAMLMSLTGQEILSIIGKIRGIPAFSVRDAVTLWLHVMGIKEHGEKRCGTYSGGTKRKLSTAMALIGSPEVVFMDEPTTGVDPASRRKLWTVIKEMQKQGQAVVLTSHSMEECEALCTRLTIMVGGKMKCIGNVEYLKTKFGNGFAVQLKLGEHTEEDLEKLKSDFKRVFPENKIEDEHDILINYTILNPKLPLSQLFADLLQFKTDHPVVTDFTASNTNLEQLFLSFAKNTQQRVTK